MIAVIADDLTGAAEIAGIGWRHGLRAEILARDERPIKTDLLVYDSDSRLCGAKQATERVNKIFKRLQRIRPGWIYKKVDSVLRGNVVAEIEAAMKILKCSRCLLVSANPGAGRIVRDGRYYVRGVPINRTDFRNDPQHPRTSSRVTDLLVGHRSLAVSVAKLNDMLPAEGIIAGEAIKSRDVGHWASQVRNNTLAAGGAEFFTALLHEHGFRPRRNGMKNIYRENERVLFICGTLAARARDFLRLCQRNGWPVLQMPAKLPPPGKMLAALKSRLARKTVLALASNQTVAIAARRPILTDRSEAARLGRVLVAVAARVLVLSRPNFVCVEGGATAAALTAKMEWTRLTVEHEFKTGVTSVRPHKWKGVSLVLKPGSYEWPETLIRRANKPKRSRPAR